MSKFIKVLSVQNEASFINVDSINVVTKRSDGKTLIFTHNDVMPFVANEDIKSVMISINEVEK